MIDSSVQQTSFLLIRNYSNVELKKQYCKTDTIFMIKVKLNQTVDWNEGVHVV